VAAEHFVLANWLEDGMQLKCLVVAAIATTVSVAGHSQVVFADNFNADAVGLNAVPAGWSVTGGTVDIIGSGFFDFLPGNGNYIDLDGSSGAAGLLSTSPLLSLNAGVTYSATFDLAGSQRGLFETGVVTFGTSTLNYAIASATGFSAYTLTFTPGTSGLYALSFQNTVPGDVGALLDNVVVSGPVVGAVPEPGTYALLIAGLLGTVLVTRWRRHKS
jgi:hypothetical protein